MTNTVILKRSSVANAVPTVANLTEGELALNYTDGNLFYKTAANTISVIASNKFLSVTGNVTGGNIITGGLVSATGNITGSYFIGNGSQLTGITVAAGSQIISGTSNVTVAANSNVTVGVTGTTVATFSTAGISLPGNLNATGNVTGNYIFGNGSQLTGITSNVTVGGANTNVQFNDNGALGGVVGFTFNKNTNTLAVANVNVANSLTFSSNAGGNISFVAANTANNVAFIVPVTSGTSKQVVGVIDQATQQLGWKTVPTYYISVGLRSGGSYLAPPAPVLRVYPVRLRDNSFINVATTQ
jgi:hypothetical protein